MNIVILAGRTGKDPELKYIGENSTPLCSCSLAVDKYMGKDKPRGTDWFNITLFGKRAEVFAEYVSKGSLITVKGSIEIRQYEKDGEKKYITQIKVDEFTLPPKSSTGGSSASNNEMDLDDDTFGSDDDIPF